MMGGFLHSEADVYVTRTPPVASVVGGPTKSAPSPSTVTFSFTTAPANATFGAPVTGAQCLVQPAAEVNLWACLFIVF